MDPHLRKKDHQVLYFSFWIFFRTVLIIKSAWNPPSGYLVPIPDIERSRKSLLGRGCASPGAYKLTKWRPKANRRRVRRGQWIALLYRGGCTFQEKIRLATKLGAAGAIIIDTTSNRFVQEILLKWFIFWRSPSLMNTLGTSIVSASVSKVTGDRMRGLLTRGRPLHVSMSVGRMELAKENRPSVASNNTYSVFLSQHGFTIMKYNSKLSNNMASSSFNISPASSCTFIVICLYSAISSLFM
jgi:hypothetical protein